MHASSLKAGKGDWMTSKLFPSSANINIPLNCIITIQIKLYHDKKKCKKNS